MTETEDAYAADRGLAAGRRLGCTALIAQDVVIDVPPESQVYRQVVRKEADARTIAVDPVARLYFVEVEEPQLASPRSDLARLLEALEREWDLHDLSVDPTVLRSLQHDLRREPAWRVTVAVHGEGKPAPADLLAVADLTLNSARRVGPFLAGLARAIGDPPAG